MLTIRPLVIASCAAAAALLAAGCGDDEAADTTTTEEAAATTSAVDTTDATDTTDTGGATEDADVAVWPPVDGDVTYDDPIDAATGFATELIGFTDPVVGGFRQGDTRSGEVEVQPRADGPTTTVFVRQLDGEDWSVVGAATANIVLGSPGTLDEITSPVTLSGRATAFEGTVQTAVSDADGERLGEGFVTGGSFGELGPFEGELAFDAPSGANGSVVLFTVSARDGTVDEATAIAVRFPTG